MKKIIDFLQGLIAASYALRIEWKNLPRPEDDDHLFTYIQMRARWLHSCVNVLSYAGLTDYLEQVARIRQDGEPGPAGIAEITGILESARDALQQGLPGKIRYLLHAELFNSVLDQAGGLLETGHRIPAAVLGRIVIEGWLRDQAEKADIAGWEVEKASTLNENLKKAGVFPVPKWRHIQSLIDIGNSAAHGKDAEFSEEDVKRMIVFAQTNCVRAFRNGRRSGQTNARGVRQQRGVIPLRAGLLRGFLIVDINKYLDVYPV